MPKLTKFNSFKTDFLIFRAKKAFIYVQKAFTKGLIFRHFDSECYIHIKTNVSEYGIGGVLS